MRSFEVDCCFDLLKEHKESKALAQIHVLIVRENLNINQKHDVTRFIEAGSSLGDLDFSRTGTVYLAHAWRRFFESGCGGDLVLECVLHCSYE